jgi:hypothetical protein
MILFYPGWRDYYSILGDDLETVLFEQTGQERVQDKEPGAEPREFPRSGIITGDDSGAQSEMEKIAGHRALLIPQASPLT